MKNFERLFVSSAIAGLVLLLVACGGNGSNSSPGSNPYPNPNPSPGTTSGGGSSSGSGPSLMTPTVTVTPGATSITTAQPLSVTVAVNGGTGNPAATGSVTLSGGGFTSTATALANGGTTIAIAAGKLSTGTDTLSVAYTPDTASAATYNSATGTGSVTVTAVAAAPTVTLTASLTNLTSGASSTLMWSSTNATSCNATGGWSGTQTTSGTLSVKPTVTSTYQLECTGPGGTANASVTVTVTGGTGGTTGGAFSLSTPFYNVVQSAGSLTVTVNRTGGNTAAAVNYATSDTIAVAGTDYTATSGTLSFAAGDTAQTFTIPINNATPFGGSRSFTIKLSGPTSGATLDTNASALATIFGTAPAPNAKSSLGFNVNGVTN